MTRPRQLREMVDADLRARVDEIRKGLFNLRTRAATKSELARTSKQRLAMVVPAMTTRQESRFQ